MGGNCNVNRGLIIGKTNVGKTLFCIHFARYMGIKEMQWLVERTDGRTEHRRMSLAEAEASLSGPAPHRTRNLQSVAIEFPRGKGSQQLLLSDTTGLTDGIHPEAEVREAMAQTLQAMMNARVILHVVDAADIGRHTADGAARSGSGSTWDALDEQLSDFGTRRAGYLILANKMDLPDAKQGYRHLCQRFSRHRVIPISALYGTGFREVKQHVWRLA
jgi:GTPase Era involved in 16S rRNA processing